MRPSSSSGRPRNSGTTTTRREARRRDTTQERERRIRRPPVRRVRRGTGGQTEQLLTANRLSDSPRPPQGNAWSPEQNYWMINSKSSMPLSSAPLICTSRFPAGSSSISSGRICVTGHRLRESGVHSCRPHPPLASSSRSSLCSTCLALCGGPPSLARSLPVPVVPRPQWRTFSVWFVHSSATEESSALVQPADESRNFELSGSGLVDDRFEAGHSRAGAGSPYSLAELGFTSFLPPRPPLSSITSPLLPVSAASLAPASNWRRRI